MRRLKDEPKGEIYSRLIEYAIKTSEAFMFFTCDYGDVENYKIKMDTYLKDLFPLLIKIRLNGDKTTIWPGTESSDNRFQRNFMIFRSDKKAIESLIKPGRLYNWLNTDYPEDLCFFRKNYSWLSVTAHEKDCYVITNDDEIKTLQSIGLVFYEKDYSYKPEHFYEEYNLLSSDN